MHSFSFYMKKGSALTKTVLRKKNFFDKFLLACYFLASFLGKFIFFVRPIFEIADQNIGLMLNEGHDIEINKIFEGVNDKKRYTSLLLSTLFIDFICLGLAVMTVLPSILLMANSRTQMLYYIGLGLFFLSTIGVIILFCGLYVRYAPIGFVAAKGMDLTAGDVLYLANKASKGLKGKIIGLYILDNLLTVLVLGAVIAIMIIGINSQFTGMEVNIAAVITTGVCALAIPILQIFVFSRQQTKLVASLYALYSENVEVKHIVIAKRDASTFEEYTALFTDDKEVK